MDNIFSIRDRFASLLHSGAFTIDKSGSRTIELIGESFIADQNHIFGEINQDYIDRELAWYKSKSLFVKDIPGKTPVIWEQVASTEGKINSNYGYLIWSPENHEQYLSVFYELRNNPNSRRAVMIYTRPTMHADYNKNGMSDFICTNAVNYFIRDNKLHAVVQMRSNDAVYGYRNDYAWQKYVLDMLAEDLEIEAGRIVWNAASLHIYERHFHLVENYIRTDLEETTITKADFDQKFGQPQYY